jgi:hypothetical protein
MKNIIRILIAFMSIASISCTDDVKDRAAVSTNTAPVLKSPTTLTMVLNHDNPNDPATTVVWDYAAYNGTQTVVNYRVEFAAAGTNFASPTVVATTTNKFENFSVGELNSAALNAGFAPFIASDIDVRVTATVGSTGSLPQTSNFLTINLTPYPAWPNWGIIGDATPTGWGSDTNMDYSLTTHLYSITMHMVPGGYKFRLDDGWATNFGDDGGDLSLDPNGANIPITVEGDYKIVANFSSTDLPGMLAKHYTATLQ